MSARNFDVYGTKRRFGTVTVDRPGPMINVTLHKTVIVGVFEEKEVQLNTGGWYTVTTKTAINHALDQICRGFRVYSEKGTWYLYFMGQKVAEFHDNMVFNPEDQEYREIAKQGGIL